MSNELAGLTLDHFLVEHTKATAGIIADAVNKGSYTAIDIELYGNPEAQSYNQDVLQDIVDRRIKIDVDELPEEGAVWAAFAGFDQVGTRVVAIDRKHSDYYDQGIAPSLTADDFIDFVYRRAHLSQLREPIMAQQVREDWLANGRTSEPCALITGRHHVFPSVQLARWGAKTKRFMLEGEVSPISDGRFFDEVSAAVRTIVYGTRSDEEIKAWLTNYWNNLE